MAYKQLPILSVTLDRMIGGGQAIGTLATGQKALVWNGLPGETVTFQVTKKKSHFVEGVVTEVAIPSSDRITPLDADSYLSTSPWQMMTYSAEQHYKAALIEEAFELHDIVLPETIEVYSDNRTSAYRNKVEFSWYSTHDEETGADTLDLAFFRRGSKGKIIVDSCSLLPDSIMMTAREIRDLLRRKGVTARSLKTLLIRCDQAGNTVWQLYIKDMFDDLITAEEAAQITAQGGEVIYSDPRSPASRITKRMNEFDNVVLTDTVLGVPFRYATEGFFQVNIPVYEQALRDMQQWVEKKPVVDLYSGVGSIGLTIGGDNVTLVEINEDAVREMRRNISELGRDATVTPVLAPSEKALDYITSDACVIVDPPRAGLHVDVITKLLEVQPGRIIYLSCNPVTQARDIALLAQGGYGVRAHRGYNFFPRTPHIENLVILDRAPQA